MVELPAFGAFLRGTALKGEAKIEIDPDACLLVSAEHNINFYELLSEITVHEMLHAFQELYKQAFDEDQVEMALEQAKKFLEENEIHSEVEQIT